MRTAIVGGSAQSTPALFDTAWALGTPQFSFEIIGRSQSRLAAVRRAIECVALEREFAVDCRIATVDMLDAAIEVADVVLVQLRAGGYPARAYDETFPHRYGLCGDEGLGVGGLAAAWRTWSELRPILSTIARRNPGARVILLTSPIGILTRCARSAFPSLSVFGICELPWTTLTRLCANASVDAAAATYSYAGINHLGWFSDVRAGSRTIVTAQDIYPLKYVRLNDAPADVLSEQLAAVPRGRELADMASDAFATYKNGSPTDVLAAVRRRETPWYAHAVAPLLRSFAGDDTGVSFFLTAKNAGYHPRFDDDDVVEMPFIVRNGKLERVRPKAWQRDDIADTLLRLINYERQAAQAVLSGNISTLRTALRAHPWLDGHAVTDQLVADVVAPAATAWATSSR